ncbi:glycoside hydrolase superfamily [Whalleya microplaca]|nr:glycoside hydrolase superfamily [Whalleya microplaca]
MKSATLVSAVTILAATANGSPVDSAPQPRSTNTGTTLPGLPKGCMTSKNGIAWGWLPDDGSNGAVNMKVLNSDTGKKACFFGDYSHISSTSYDGSDITGKAGSVEGAIMVPSIMPTGVKWNQIDSTLAGKIGNAVRAFTQKGITTYLRFAHEMNCYGKPKCASPAYPGYQDYAGFKQAWINVAKECRAIDGCYMVWSPNLQDLDSLNNWFPGNDYIDVIAVDHYPRSDSDVANGFAGNFGTFYDQFVKPNNKPFMIGETAYGGSLAQKDAWVKALTTGDFSKYPLYHGAMWFEYNKEANFYVVYDQSQDQIKTFDGNFA